MTLKSYASLIGLCPKEKTKGIRGKTPEYYGKLFKHQLFNVFNRGTAVA